MIYDAVIKQECGLGYWQIWVNVWSSGNLLMVGVAGRHRLRSQEGITAERFAISRLMRSNVLQLERRPDDDLFGYG